MKVIGITELKSIDEIIINENFIKRTFNIDNLEGKIRRIFKLTVIPRIINVSKLEDSESARILFLLKLRILYLVENEPKIQIFESSIIKEITVKIPIGLDIGNNETSARTLEKFAVEVKKIKATIEDTCAISTNFWTIITLQCARAGDYWFSVTSDTSSENLFYWDNVKKELIQRTFFNRNNIINLDISNGSGYILTVEENRKNIYCIENNRITKVPFIYDDGEMLYVIRDYNNQLIIAIEILNKVSIYIYNNGRFEIFIENIFKNIKAIYVENSFIYVRKVAESFQVIRTYCECKNESNYIKVREEIILESNEIINVIKISNNKKFLAILLDNSKGLIYDLNGNLENEITLKKFENKIEDIYFTHDRNIILIKVIQNEWNDIIVKYLNNEFYENITDNNARTIISSVFALYDMSYVYLSDNSMYGYNIYRINMKSLEKELLLELNAKSVKFIE